jgi:hypothetical protein
MRWTFAVVALLGLLPGTLYGQEPQHLEWASFFEALATDFSDHEVIAIDARSSAELACCRVRVSP